MMIERCYRRCLVWANGGPVFILGDFKWYDFSRSINVQNDPEVESYVTCPTGGEDNCYGNVRQAYSSLCRPPLLSANNIPSSYMVILLTREPQTCTHWVEEVEQLPQMAILTLNDQPQ
ncbi:hypothetical protein AALO_G00088080 [Alosa alosa]|uniref:Uncharacterized protein n=1 Tax=Alosa alosa TaxID=278164 RepID=A0AAV6H320_9TELE|nr:hypothetical protein AALO_G00088080 [Alosa alosa]